MASYTTDKKVIVIKTSYSSGGPVDKETHYLPDY
jgi:hypothetical protein